LKIFLERISRTFFQLKKVDIFLLRKVWKIQNKKFCLKVFPSKKPTSSSFFHFHVGKTEHSAFLFFPAKSLFKVATTCILKCIFKQQHQKSEFSEENTKRPNTRKDYFPPFCTPLRQFSDLLTFLGVFLAFIKAFVNFFLKRMLTPLLYEKQKLECFLSLFPRGICLKSIIHLLHFSAKRKERERGRERRRERMERVRGYLKRSEIDRIERERGERKREGEKEEMREKESDRKEDMKDPCPFPFAPNVKRCSDNAGAQDQRGPWTNINSCMWMKKKQL
jgi:hypothetical protein